MVPRTQDLGARHQHAAQRGHRASSRRVRIRACPSTATRSTTSSASLHTKDLVRWLVTRRHRRHAGGADPSDHQRARERHRRPRAPRTCASGARIRRSSSTSSAARRACSRSRTCCRSSRRRRRRVQAGRSGGRIAARRAHPAARRHGGRRCGGALRRTWETDATTVGGLVTEALGHLPVAGRDASAIGDYEFEVERVADRAVESVLARRIAPTTTRRRHDRVLFAIVIILLLVLANGLFVAAEFAIVGAPRATHRASGGAGQPAGAARRAHPRGSASGRIATSPRRRSASRSPASASGCTASTCSPSWIAPWLEPFDGNRVDCRARAGQRHRDRHPHLPAHRHRRDGAEGAGAAAARDTTVLYVSPVIEALEVALLPLVVGLNAHRQRPAAPGRHPAAGGRGRALSHDRGAAVHRPGEPGRRPAARRVGPHPARAVRVRRPDGGRGDGAPRPARRHPGRQPNRTTARRSCARIPHTRYPVYAGDLDTSSAACTSRTCCGTSSPDRPVTARDARPLPYVPATDAARRSAGGDAPIPRADGGGHGRARRHRRTRDDRGSVRRGRRRDRGRPRACADRARRRTAAAACAAPSGSKDAGEALGVTLEHRECSR